MTFIVVDCSAIESDREDKRCSLFLSVRRRELCDRALMVFKFRIASTGLHIRELGTVHSCEIRWAVSCGRAQFKKMISVLVLALSKVSRNTRIENELPSQPE